MSTINKLATPVESPVYSVASEFGDLARLTASNGHGSQSDTITHQPHAAILVLATTGIINPIAVAHIEAAQTTVPPDRVLDETGKDAWKRWIELPGINPLRNDLNDISAAARLVASYAIIVFGPKPTQDAGAVQKVMN